MITNWDNQGLWESFTNTELGETVHHPVFLEVKEHDKRLKQIEDTKKVFWNLARQILDNSGSETQSIERLWKFTREALIDIDRILNQK